MSPKRLRALAIAEWRGYAEPVEKPDRTVPVGAVLTKVMADLGLKEKLFEDEVLAAWRDIVGEFFSKHSSPQRLKDGVLYVHVLQPTVHFELERVWKRDVLQKLKTRFGTRKVRDVKFRIG